MISTFVVRPFLVAFGFPVIVLLGTVRSPGAANDAAHNAARRWNANGHMTTAAIAWTHMTPKARARAVALLKGAPALAQLAELEPTEGTPEERERQLFLHSLWDGALDMADAVTSGTQAARVDRLATVAEDALPFASVPAARLSASFDVWGKESLDLAQHELYPPALHAGEKAPPEYEQRALKIAEDRVAMAGYRLATLLNRVLGG